MRKKLLVSFSGGETSAYMAQWLWNNKSAEYEMIFVFANTGRENDETLDFVQKCEKYFEFPVVWVEAVVYPGKRKGSTHKVVNYYSASREGQPFERVIKKYGIPNQRFPHCTRELKQNPIRSYAKAHWNGEEYYTAIGIRNDEIDRMSAKAKQWNLIYPLISCNPKTKPEINTWWNNHPFRLNLKGYQGNCKTCWKKTDSKLFQIAKEDKTHFDFDIRMEETYPRIGPEFSKYDNQPDRVFFRKSRSAKDILTLAQDFDGIVIDDSDVYSESCEVFSECHNT